MSHSILAVADANLHAGSLAELRCESHRRQVSSGVEQRIDVMSVMYTDAGRGHPWTSVLARARVAAVGGRTGVSGGHKTVQVRFTPNSG